jgi:hypothetical protein
MDMTTDRRRLQFIAALPQSSQIPAWRAANPPLAAEVDRWRTDVRRTAKFTAETVGEALSFIDDEPLLETIEDSERRNGLRTGARGRIWELKRASSAPTSGPVTDAKTVFTTELLSGELQGVADQLKYIGTHRVCNDTLRVWLQTLNDEELDIVWQTAQPQPFLVTELLNRKKLKQLEASLKGTSISNIARPLQDMDELDADIARFAISMELAPGMLSKCRWNDEAISVFREARHYPTLLMMHQMSISDVLTHSIGLTLSELEAISSLDLTPREVTMLHDEVIRLEAEHGSVSSAVVYRLERAGNITAPLREVYVKNCEPHHIMHVLLQVEPEERERLISVIASHRPDAFERLFSWLNNTDESLSSVALFERLIPETGANVVMALQGGRGWVSKRIATLIATELSDDDWAVFFAVATGFPGTIAELIDTVKTLQQSS